MLFRAHLSNFRSNAMLVSVRGIVGGLGGANCGSLHAPVPGLLVSLVIYVELKQEGLDITLVLDDPRVSI